MSLPDGQANDIADLEWPRYKNKDLATVMFGATSINATRLASSAPIPLEVSTEKLPALHSQFSSAPRDASRIFAVQA